MIDNIGNKKAVKTVSLIIFATAFSKVLGLARDMIMAPLYGGTTENSAMIVASDIPLNFFEILLGAAILGVFIPVYNSFEKGEQEKAEEFANIFLNFVILMTGLLVLAGIIFAEQIVNVMTDFDENTKKLTVDLLRIMLPTAVFAGSISTFTGILQSKGEFLAPALVSAFSNLCVILYFLFFNKYFGIYGLACAYLISWFVQLLTLAVPLIRKKYKYRFKIDFKNLAFIRAIKITLPIIAGSWLVPMSKQIANKFSSMCENFNVVMDAFTKSWSLFLIITGILTYGVCNYIFPKLAQNADNEQDFAEILKNSLSVLAFIIMPVACIAFVLRGEAIAVLYMRGEFTPEIAMASAEMFAFLAPAMLAFSFIEFSNRVFYSKNLVKFPMVAALSGIAVNFILCWIFIEVLELAPVYIAVAGLICQIVTACILIIALKIKIRGIFNINFLLNIAKIVLSSGIALIITHILYFIINNNAFKSRELKNILTAAVIVIAGAGVYLGTNFILRTNEAKAMMNMIKIKKR